MLGEVAVHVQHARISLAEKTDAAALELADRRRRADPVLNLLPGALRIGMAGRRFTKPAALDPQHAGHDVEINAAARKGAGNLGHAAGATIRQPFPGVGLGVIQRADRLQIEDQHRGAGFLDGWQHLAARGIGADVTDDQLHSFVGEERARGGRRRRRIHQPGVHHVAEPVQVTADDALVALEPGFQALELRPVGRQANAEQPDFASLSLGFHTAYLTLSATVIEIPAQYIPSSTWFARQKGCIWRLGDYCARATDEAVRHPSLRPAARHNA